MNRTLPMSLHASKLILLLAGLMFAQSSTAATTSTSTTTVTLGTPFDTTPAVVPSPAPPIVVTLGSRLILNAPKPGTTYGAVQWYKDGKLLPASGATFEIASVSTPDTGNYYCSVVSTPDGKTTFLATPAGILVSGRLGQRLINISHRATISPTQRKIISGFVVEPGPDGYYTYLLIRAVGPSLTKFGVTDALAAPQITIYAANSPTTAVAMNLPKYEVVAPKVGAFPLLANAKDATTIIALPAGAYTAEVSSADNGTGTVLLEIYEIPPYADDVVRIPFPPVQTIIDPQT